MSIASEFDLVWPFIDVHAHVGMTVNRTPPVGQSFEKYLARMAQSNVVAAISSTAGGGPRERGILDVRDQNDATAAGCRRYPDRFPIGLALLEAGFGQAAVDEIERAMTDAGLAGLMCHPGMSGHALDATLHPALEVVDARVGLALLHVGGRDANPSAAADLARHFRRTTFIMAHVSMNERQHRESIAAFAGLENVWCDFAQHPGHPATAAGAGGPWDIVDLVRGLSASRLVFGSDTPYYDYRYLQQEIEAARIDAPRKDRITWANAADLIHRFRPNWTPPRTPPAVPDEFDGVDVWQHQPGKPLRLS
jgi:predicted TIM-barrel fold metal-dependent hydrolase